MLLLLACTFPRLEEDGAKDDTSDGTNDDTDLDDSGESGDSGSDGCPHALTSPDYLTWDDVAHGSTTPRSVSLVNDCTGDGALSVLAEVDDDRFLLDAAAFSLAPGEVATLTVTFDAVTYEGATGTLSLRTNDLAQEIIVLPVTATVDPDTDGDGHDAAAAGGDDCDDDDDAVSPAEEEIWYDGVDQDCDGNDDDQDGDGFVLADDCDDTDVGVSPGAAETWYDGVDQDCDGRDDDQDRDGYAVAEDCDDLDPDVNPAEVERWYDGTDQDCDGHDDDQDGDGFDLAYDCDDLDAGVHPAATEIWYDGTDQNCDGNDDDQDGDGFVLAADCDDTDARVSPAATEVWYDGTDQDCDGNDDDQDGDSFPLAVDCDDLAAGVHPGVSEVWYDGVDQDCDGNDDDQDGDSFPLAVDCDDLDDGVNPAAAEVWYDGVDQDCDGSDDDQDGDGFVLADDCDDLDDAVNPARAEVWYDGIDQDCDGSDDDQDGDGFVRADDCDDEDAGVSPTAAEVWYDGTDQDCDGNDDDQDGDGFVRADDCDDEDAEVNPGATETWYDGVDQDCDGANDNDRDGDGEEAPPTGVDCNDTDATVTGPTTEVENGVDDDCDGDVDEGFVQAGDIVISEVLPNPIAAPDATGEWFEVYNPGAADRDLLGWVVSAADGGTFTIDESLVVPAGGYALLGADSDPTTNGGLTVDFAYGRDTFTLSDIGDSIVLTAGGTTVASLSWTAAWPDAPGTAMQLDNDHLDASSQGLVTHWCVATQAWSGGDLGSPGEPNGDCGTLDDDHDGDSLADCDDDDPTRNTGAAEVEDGVDNDCDGVVDDQDVDWSGGPVASGASSYGYLYPWGIADLDGDDTLEVVGYGSGAETMYLLTGPDWASWSGSITSLAEQTFRPNSASDDTFIHSERYSDVSGDGVADLVYTSIGSLGTSGFAVYSWPLTSGSTVPADLRLEPPSSTDAANTNTPVDASADFDGDGVAEILYGNAYSAPSTRSDYYGSVGIFEVAGRTGTVDWSAATVRLQGSLNASARCGQDADTGDFDGDGYVDLVVGCANTDVYVWLGDGLATTGTLSLEAEAVATIDLSTAFNSGTITVEDFDKDGADDVALGYLPPKWYLDVASSGGTIDGDTPDAAAEIQLLPSPGRADVDGDGVLERAWVDFTTTDSDVMFFAFGDGGDGVVTPSDAGALVTLRGCGVCTVDTADLDADGDLELIAASAYYGIYAGGIGVVDW